MESIDNSTSELIITMMSRLSTKDLEILKLLERDFKVSMREIEEATGMHRNTASKSLSGLYKCCLINIEHKFEEKNKIEYRITNFGKSVLRKIKK